MAVEAEVERGYRRQLAHYRLDLPSNQTEERQELIGRILERVEDERFESAQLAALTERLESRGTRPSRAIARLTRVVEIEQSRHNPIFAALGGLVLLFIVML